MKKGKARKSTSRRSASGKGRAKSALKKGGSKSATQSKASAAARKSKAPNSKPQKSASHQSDRTAASANRKSAGRTASERSGARSSPRGDAADSAAADSTAGGAGTAGGASASQLIDGRIKELGDWRGETLSRIRALIKEADPEVTEEWKWRGVPVWSHDGLICTGETYTNVVKMTFAKGASLPDPGGLFNSSLEGNTRRAIDVHQGENINEEALKTLIRAAVSLNQSKGRR